VPELRALRLLRRDQGPHGKFVFTSGGAQALTDREMIEIRKARMQW
jgi:hypothetical protein